MKIWILYAYDDPDDAAVLESFSSKPILSYILEAFGTGTALVEYDVVDDGKLINPVMVSPKERNKK